ncbi:hypothetical protein ACE6H2_010507 [Prunus campanulata]
MSYSFQSYMDLSLAPPIQTRVQPLEPIWAPYFASSRGPVIVNDSLLLDNDVAIGVARSLVTPRDLRILGMWDGNRIVSNVVAMGVQSAACIASVGHRLIAKTHEVQFLKAQLTAEQKLVDEYQRDNRRLKKEIVIFGSSSDEPQEAVRENPGEEIQSAKLKAPIVQI